MQLGGWLDPQHLLNAFGLVGMGVIVFAESGLLIGLFLPGDSLLFTAGIPAAAGRLSLPLLLPVAFLAAAAGDSVGYGFGRRAGPSLYQRDDARLFRRQHLERARRFYERLGRTIPSIDRYLLPAIAVIVGVSLLPLALRPSGPAAAAASDAPGRRLEGCRAVVMGHDGRGGHGTTCPHLGSTFIREWTMNVAVIGSGNGGMAVGFDWAQHGHRVAVYSQASHADNIDAVRAKGGITSQGRLEGFAPVVYCGTDAAAAMAGAEAVFVVGPAFATEPLARDLAPHLQAGMTVVVCPGSCAGALAFKEAAGLAVVDDSIVVGETSTLPYAARADGGGNVHVFHRFDSGLFAAAVPRSANDRLLGVLRQVYPSIREAATIFQTTLQNGNPVIHPAVTLTNAALIERTAGDFRFYEDGITPAVGRLIEAVDGERLAIAAALGVRILSEPDLGVEQGYMTESNYSTGYSKAPGFLGIKAPDRLASRYLTEDVGYTMVLFTDLARRLGVPTPVMDSIIELTSVVLERDLREEAPRTLGSLGLEGLSDEQLLSL